MNLHLPCLNWRAERRKLVTPSILVTRFEQLAWDSLDTPNLDDRIMVNRLSTASTSAILRAGTARDA